MGNNIFWTIGGIVAVLGVGYAISENNNNSNNQPPTPNNGSVKRNEQLEKTISIRPYAYYKINENISKVLKIKLIADYENRQISIGYIVQPSKGFQQQGSTINLEIDNINKIKPYSSYPYVSVQVDDDLTLKYSFVKNSNTSGDTFMIMLNSRVFGDKGIIRISFSQKTIEDSIRISF